MLNILKISGIFPFYPNYIVSFCMKIRVQISHSPCLIIKLSKKKKKICPKTYIITNKIPIHVKLSLSNEITIHVWELYIVVKMCLFYRQKCIFRPYILTQFPFWSLLFIFTTFSPYFEKHHPFQSLSLVP